MTVAGKPSGSWYPAARARWVLQLSTSIITDLLKPLASAREQSVTDLQTVQQHLARFKAEGLDQATDAKKKETLHTIVARCTRVRPMLIQRRKSASTTCWPASPRSPMVYPGRVHRRREDSVR